MTNQANPATTPAVLQNTALTDLHIELGARLVPFAGYQMPVQYPLGILKEHLHTRSSAGLFDVSHMGQVLLTPKADKTMHDLALAFEKIVPIDVVDLPLHKQRYAIFTNANGGIEDDLMISNLGNAFFVVVNAACKQQDVAHLRAHLSDVSSVIELTEHALLALQGPQAATVLARLLDVATSDLNMVFMDAKPFTILGEKCIVSRSGYTGEDGFEISIPNSHALELARWLLLQPEVAAIGLGARDSLRLEAGLCLYGHDIDTKTTPVEAALMWAIPKVRRAEGARAGGYVGAEIIQQQQNTGAAIKRVGLKINSKMPVREGAEITDASGKFIGQVTSGGFAPSLEAPIAMGYVTSENSAIGTQLNAIVRGKPVPIEVAKTPFVVQRYFRG